MRLWTLGVFVFLLASVHCAEESSPTSTTGSPPTSTTGSDSDTTTTNGETGGTSTTNGDGGGETSTSGSPGSTGTSQSTTQGATDSTESTTSGPTESTQSTTSGPSTTKGPTESTTSQASTSSHSTQSPGPSTTGPPKPTGASDETQPPTEPLVTTVFPQTPLAWSIPVLPNDPTELLRAFAALNYSVQILKSNLSDLFNNLNVNGSNNYLDKLAALNDTVYALQANTSTLATDIASARASYTASYKAAKPLMDTVQCMRDSPCNIEPTTTAWSPVPSNCPPEFLPASSETQNFFYSSGLKYKCSVTLQSVDGNPITINMNLTLSAGAEVDLNNADTGASIAKYTKDYVDEQEKTGVSAVTFVFNANSDEDLITLSVDYITEDLCTGKDCNGKGNCVVDDGKPVCVCTSCNSGDDCEVPIQPCGTDGQVKRRCLDKGGECEPDEEKDVCTWTCKCPSGKTDPTNPQTCLDSADSPMLAAAKKWLHWSD